jgi:hypothetical protein
MIKHRAFNVDRFVDKFSDDGEVLLQEFVKIWGRGLEIPVSSINVVTFKKFLVSGAGKSKEEFMAELYRVWDLCDEIGHEYLIAACDKQRPKYNPDPKGVLPVEWVSLIVRIEREDVFNLAYDMRSVRQAERFTLYQGKKGKQIAKLAAASRRLRLKLEQDFDGLKQSDQVIVRAYKEGDTFNFVIYHERRVQAPLVFKGARTRRKVAPFALRPVQQDYIRFDPTTGRAEVEARFSHEEEKLVGGFAECCLEDAQYFAKSGSRLNLGRIADKHFTLKAEGVERAALTELQFTLDQKPKPLFTISSDDVFETLGLSGLLGKLAAGNIRRAVLTLKFEGDGREKTVRLSGDKTISFPHRTHAEDVHRCLVEWKLLRE